MDTYLFVVSRFVLGPKTCLVAGCNGQNIDLRVCKVINYKQMFAKGSISVLKGRLIVSFVDNRFKLPDRVGAGEQWAVAREYESKYAYDTYFSLFPLTRQFHHSLYWLHALQIVDSKRDQRLELEMMPSLCVMKIEAWTGEWGYTMKQTAALS